MCSIKMESTWKITLAKTERFSPRIEVQKNEKTSLTTVVPVILITHVPTVIITITDPVSLNAPVIVTLELRTGTCYHMGRWNK